MLVSSIRNVVVTAMLLVTMLFPWLAHGEERVDDTVEVMEIFNQQAIEDAKARGLSDDRKHQILFFMGAALLVLLCVTAYMGISMVVFNKEVFVPHMVCAGLTVTLGVAHAVAAMVWFYPF